MGHAKAEAPAAATSGVDQESFAALTNQPQEPPTTGEPLPPPDYEVRVTLTIAIPYRGERHPGCRDANERVFRVLQTANYDDFPRGTHYHGMITTTVRSAKEVVADRKRAIARAKREGRS